MSRIQNTFTSLRQQGRKALIPFFVVGDPNPEDTVPLMHKLVAAGADVIELGIPFSDPMADGPIIQQSSEKALAKGVSLQIVLDKVADFRRQDDETPLVLMGYANCVEAMGKDRFVKQATDCGVDGVLLVDLPPEESVDLSELCQRAGLHRIFMVAPTTDDARLATICQQSSGFLYYVSLKGVTGSTHADWPELARRLQHIAEKSQVPLAVGFGIRSAEDAVQAAKCADGIVVGSALIESMEGAVGEQARVNAAHFLSSLRTALDGAVDVKAVTAGEKT